MVYWVGPYVFSCTWANYQQHAKPITTLIPIWEFISDFNNPI